MDGEWTCVAQGLNSSGDVWFNRLATEAGRDFRLTGLAGDVITDVIA